MMLRHPVSSFLSVLLLCALASPAAAQVTTGQISGTVLDVTSEVMAGAEVLVRNQDMGISRTVKTDQQGRYDVPNLVVGKYEVVVTVDGFKTETRSGLVLTVGGHVVINFRMEPGAVSEQVTVTGEAPLVETATSAVGALVSREQIRDLPLNGRDYTQLALLQPGVVPYREQSKELNRGMGTRFSISGARHNQVGFRLNGIDVGDAAGNTPGSATGNNLGVDAIQEFQVLTNTFSAEQGKSAGGVVNIIHKSGTNAMHGTAFEYFRDSALDARNFFDPGAAPPFRRNQFGGTAGGPLLKNRTFYFGAYEGLREQLSLTGINVVLSDAAKNGALGPVAASVKPYLDAIPTANGRVFANGTAEYVSQVNTESTENYVVGKVDHTFSAADSISGSYTLDKGQVIKPNPRDGIVTYATTSQNKFQYVTLQQTHIFSNSVLHVLRGGFNQSHTYAIRDPLIQFPKSLKFVPEVDFSSVEVSGIDRFGMAFAPVTDRELTLDSFQVSNSLNWMRGAHSFKTGMEAYRYKIVHTSFGRAGGGRYVFDSIPLFLQGRPSTFQTEDPSAPRRPIIHQNVFGFFVQDDVRLGSRMTLNAGLRYEFITTPRSNGANEATLIDLLDPKLTTSDTFIRNPSLKNFAPRAGIAWDVFGTQRTAVRGGIGLYHDQITSYYYLQVIEGNPPFGLSRSVSNAPFPNGQALINSGALPSAFDLTLLEYDLKQPSRLQYNIGLQQEVGRSTAVAVFFVGARGYNNPQFFLNANGRAPVGKTADGRLLFDARSPRANPNFGIIQYRTTTGESWYKSLQLLLNRRATRGFSFQASYTLQKNEDMGSALSNSSEGLNTVAQQSIYAAGEEFERGLSAFDMRHNLSVNMNYDVPSGDGLTGAAKAIAAGWQLSAIVNLSAGSPFTPILGFDNANVLVRSRGDHLRPDLKAGGNPNPVDPGNVDQYFDPRQFVLPPAGTLGTLPRDTIIGPGVAVVDGSIKKRFQVGGTRLVEFRTEVFNILNRANFRVPEDTQRTVIARGGVYNSTAGRLTATSTTSRQVQFSLRFEF